MRPRPPRVRPPLSALLACSRAATHAREAALAELRRAVELEEGIRMTHAYPVSPQERLRDEDDYDDGASKRARGTNPRRAARAQVVRDHEVREAGSSACSGGRHDDHRERRDDARGAAADDAGSTREQLLSGGNQPDRHGMTDSELLKAIGSWWRQRARSFPRVEGQLPPEMCRLLNEATKRDDRCVCLSPSGPHDLRCPARKLR